MNVYLKGMHTPTNRRTSLSNKINLFFMTKNIYIITIIILFYLLIYKLYIYHSSLKITFLGIYLLSFLISAN